MSLVCIASQGESPGATTASLLLTGLWPKAKRNKLFVEADPSGGSLASRYQLSLDPNLVSLAKAVDTGVARKRLWRTAQLLPGSVEAIIGPNKPADAEEVLTAHGEQLGSWLSRLRKVDVFADVGELQSTASSVEFVSCSSMLLMVTRPDLRQLERGAERMRVLSDSVPTVGWLLIGDQPYGAKEVEAAYDFPVLGVLADDPQTATALEQGSSIVHLTDSALVQSASQVVESVQKVLAESAPPRKVRLVSPSTPGKKPSENVDVERPPSLVSDLPIDKEVTTSAPVRQETLACMLSSIDGSQNLAANAQPDNNATAQVSAVPTDPPPTVVRALSEEVVADVTTSPIAASKFWESTTRLAAPASELSAVSPNLKPVGSSNLASTRSLEPRVSVETGTTTPTDSASNGADLDVDDPTGGNGTSRDTETTGGRGNSSATTTLFPNREMSITEVIETVHTPTGQIDVPPSLVSGAAAEKVEVPPSFFSPEPSENDVQPGESVVYTDEFDSAGDGGIRPPSLLDAKLSSSANSADGLPGYPPLR